MWSLTYRLRHLKNILYCNDLALYKLVKVSYISFVIFFFATFNNISFENARCRLVIALTSISSHLLSLIFFNLLSIIVKKFFFSQNYLYLYLSQGEITPIEFYNIKFCCSITLLLRKNSPTIHCEIISCM